MSDQQSSRTLLKSAPELWAECSDAQSLARHLEIFFGEIRITRLEPETTVAWEGERASGTVKLEPAGWGTRVTLTASAGAERTRSAVDEPPASRPVLRPATFLAHLRRRFGSEPHEPVPGGGAVEEPPPGDEGGRTTDVLAAALDSLGKAHHRPFSRA